ncbi:MAG: hypothetical protein HZB80_11415 [Deltaproteobacteria bacterium]|nr:hypothetical protein [Deltaproteobacteria bacterium]
MRRRLIIFTLIILLAVQIIPSKSVLADDAVMMRNIFTDALYGGAVGTLIGVAFMLISDKPSDNWNYLAYGAGGGIIAGAAIGMASSTKALAEVEHGKITLNVPEIKTDVIYDKRDQEMEVVKSLSLLRYNF